MHLRLRGGGCTTQQLGDTDSLEADKLSTGLVHIQPWSGPRSDTTAGWDKHMTDNSFIQQMGPLLGNINALERRRSQKGLIMCL